MEIVGEKKKTMKERGRRNRQQGRRQTEHALGDGMGKEVYLSITVPTSYVISIYLSIDIFRHFIYGIYNSASHLPCMCTE